jgi:hypothetical protein
VRLSLRRDAQIRQAYIDPDLAVLVRTGKAAR